MFANLPLHKISFRLQIALLGMVVMVLLGSVLIASLSAFHYTKSSVLKEEQGNLADITAKLAQECRERENAAGQNHTTGPLGNPDAYSSQQILTLLTRLVVQNYPGVEGGYYSAANDKINLYTSDHVPDNTEAQDAKVEAERKSELVQAAHEAVAANQNVQRVFTTDGGIVLLHVMPILGGSGHGVGVWTTKMFPGLPGSNRFRAYVMVACLGAGALLCVILTLLVVRNLQAGVQKLERGLQELEADLTSQIQTQGEPDEIKRIALAVNRLGAALKGKIESEKMTEDRLRHSERLAALGRLVAGVAHEVRNPLATIRLRVQMCQEATDEPLIQQSCAVALEEIERLNGMVNRLLSFSRPVRLHPEPTNLPHLVEQRLAYFRESALNHRVKVISNSGENSRLVSVDQSRMTQVFDNVIQNAIEAMSERGGNLCVNINTDVDNGPGSSVCVEFNDTGNGIAEADLDRVFDPFFTTKPTGTGLGLSICHELVRAQGGEIQIVSARGHGTSVRVVLPTNHELATSASG